MTTSSAVASSKSKQVFPEQLYMILEAAELEGFEDIVSWVGTNDGFIIHNPMKFEAILIPRFFKKQTKFKSFLRQLYLYRFDRIWSKGDSSIKRGEEYYFRHEDFIRGRFEQCKLIRRPGPVRSSSSSSIRNILTAERPTSKDWWASSDFFDDDGRHHHQAVLSRNGEQYDVPSFGEELVPPQVTSSQKDRPIYLSSHAEELVLKSASSSDKKTDSNRSCLLDTSGIPDDDDDDDDDDVTPVSFCVTPAAASRLLQHRPQIHVEPEMVSDIISIFTSL